MHVQGEGVLADIFRALVTQFDPIEKSEMTIDTRPCLPNPRHPDFATFDTIGLQHSVIFIQKVRRKFDIPFTAPFRQYLRCLFPDGCV